MKWQNLTNSNKITIRSCCKIRKYFFLCICHSACDFFPSKLQCIGATSSLLPPIFFFHALSSLTIFPNALLLLRVTPAKPQVWYWDRAKESNGNLKTSPTNLLTIKASNHFLTRWEASGADQWNRSWNDFIGTLHWASHSKWSDRMAESKNGLGPEDRARAFTWNGSQHRKEQDHDQPHERHQCRYISWNSQKLEEVTSFKY